METWMFFITAIVFTGLGWFWGILYTKESIVTITIESLITQGYLKQICEEMVKWDDPRVKWSDDF